MSAKHGLETTKFAANSSNSGPTSVKFWPGGTKMILDRMLSNVGRRAAFA